MNLMDMNTFLFVANISICVLCTILFALTPKRTQDTYLFGVRIPPKEQYSPEARKMKKRYIAACFVGMMALIAICIVQFVAFRDMTLIVALCLPFLIIPIFFVAYIPHWKAATHLKAERGWQISSAVAGTHTILERGRLTALPWGWYIAGFAIIMASILVANFMYGSLPNMIPVRFGINMQPTVLAERTGLTLLKFPLINGLALLIMTLVAVMIQRAKLHIDPARPQVSIAQHLVYRRRLGHAFGLFTIIIVLNLAAIGLVVLFPYSTLATRPVIFWGGWVAILVQIGAIEGLIVNSGQGGYKIDLFRNREDTTEEPVEDMLPWHDDDKHWKLGLFYHNADDPAGLVELRFGNKLGFNFARLSAKVAVALIAAGVIAAYLWVIIVVIV